MGVRMPTPETVRSRVADVNDGVLAVAGVVEGLAVAGAAQLPVIVSIAAVAGMVSVGGTRFAEETAELEVQRDLIAEEQRLLELNPEEEIAELREHFMSKGVSEVTADAVARELDAADALSAQLETEYGITDLMEPARPWKEGLGSGLFFLLGAMIPVILVRTVPREWVEEYMIFGVALSLALSSAVLARLGHTHILATILRSLFIGMAALGAATITGLLLE